MLVTEWQARGDSNPQQPVLETDALPIGATGLRLLNFFMSRMLPVKFTVLLDLHFGRLLFLVTCCTVVLSLAFSTLKLDDISHFILYTLWSPGAGLNCRPLPYQGNALPLSYPGPGWLFILNLVGRGGFEPPKAEPTDLQSVPFGHSGTSPTFRANQRTQQHNLSLRRDTKTLLQTSHKKLELAKGLEPPTC